MAVPNGEFKFAKRLNRDDIIITYDFESKSRLEEKIKSILIDPVEGFVAPLTMSGTMLVNGILASNYAIIDSQSVAHTVMAPARLWYSMSGAAWQIEKQVNGTHWFPDMLHAFTHRYLSTLVKFH